MASRTLVIKTKMDNKDFHAQIRQMEHEIEDLQYTYEALASESPYKNQAEDLRNLEADIEKATNKLHNFQVQQEKIDIQDNFNVDFSNVEKGMNKIIKRVGQWAVALFGIRTIYSGIRNAMGVVTQYNDELNNKIESIKYTLAMVLEPVITRIVNWVYRLIQYVNYLAKAWFGVDLFANASAKSISQANKNTKEMQKSMAGFDTANKLTESGKTQGVGVQPLQSLGEGEIPSWLRWIKDNGPLIGQIITTIGFAIAGLKLGDLLTSLKLISGEMTFIKGLGFGAMLLGIKETIDAIIQYINDPSWENFGKIISGIGLAVLGLGAILNIIPLTVAGVIGLIIGLVVSNWEKIKGIFENAISWIDLNMDWIGEHFGILGQTIATIFQGSLRSLLSFFNSIFQGVKTIVDGIIKIFSGDLKGGIQKVFEGLRQIMLAPINALIDGVNQLIAGMNKIKFEVPDWVPGIGGKKLGFNIPKIPKLAVGGIVNNPGRGVPVGGAIAGEAGREGVLPLTDSNTMRELGREIGKWISVNVDLTTKLDSRVLSRSMQQVQNERNFMKNGV